jgi:hypothetical protein
MMARRALVVSAVAAFAFGAADQYLGSRISLGPWAATASGVSAPWLLVPFAAGWAQPRTRAAALAGLAAVLAALLGYFVMTVSPLEGVPAGRFAAAFAAMARSNATWIAGGLLTAPLCGELGRRWRRGRALTSALLLAGCVCFEPAVRLATGRLDPQYGVWAAELGAGLALAAYCVRAIRRRPV